MYSIGNKYPKYVNKRLKKDAQNDEPHEVKSAPNYVVLTSPVKQIERFTLENQYEAEIDALDKAYSVPTRYSKDDEVDQGKSSASSYKQVENDGKKEQESNDDTSSSGSHFSPKSYDSGDYYSKYTDTPTENQKPFEKYSFAPDSGDKFTSFEFQPSEMSSKILDCHQVLKDGNVPMKCVVCHDQKTGAKTEQCAYSSFEEPKSFYMSKSEKYTKPHEAQNYRYKRSPASGDEYKDDYEKLRSHSTDYFSKPEEFESEKYKTKDDFFSEYKFPEDFFAGYASEKSQSEVEAEKMVKEGGSCKEVKKNDMTCKVCKNEKNGGTFEQCSYTSEPKEKKYAFVKNSSSKDGDDKAGESSEPKPAVKSSVNNNVHKKEDLKSEDASNQYDIPKHFIENAAQTSHGGKGLDPELYGSADSSVDTRKKFTNDDYYKRVFPEGEKKVNSAEKDEGPSFESQKKVVSDAYKHKVFPGGDSQANFVKNNEKYQGDQAKKDVEKVLEEFAKKDRSSCQKANKNGMTCFMCVNKDGTKHEECMFVAASAPKARHVAYHEIEEYKKGEEPEQSPSGTSLSETQWSPLKRKRVFKIMKRPLNQVTAASNVVKTKTKFAPVPVKVKTPRKLRRSRNPKREPAAAESSVNKVVVKPEVEPQLKTPKEFAVADNEGAYSEETRPVFSKLMGMSLPRFMVEKSDFEKEFDELISNA